MELRLTTSKNTNWEHYLQVNDKACAPPVVTNPLSPLQEAPAAGGIQPFICCVHIQRTQQETELCFTCSGLQRNKTILCLPVTLTKP